MSEFFYRTRLGSAGIFDYMSCWGIYPILCTGDANEEDKQGNEEADAEVQVDGGSWALDGSDEWECQDAAEKAD